MTEHPFATAEAPPAIETSGDPAPASTTQPGGDVSPAEPRVHSEAAARRGGKPYMSIGEVLALLKQEFKDVTISKIRFLESEGLIDPERTPSGYRKFYQADLDRLRFILKLQRDSYLPLKVIRERLLEYDAGIRLPEAKAAADPESGTAVPRPEVDVEEDLAESPAALQLSEAELAGATGLQLSQIQSLREFGVLCAHGPPAVPHFDQDDVIVGRIAREFLELGIEPRHLKMWRHFADRESALFEQAVLPLMRNRSPETRRRATETLGELARLSKKLRHAFLRQNLREYLAGDGK